MSNIDEPDTEEEKTKDTSITLELGDIIEIIAPKNADLHQETFFITYLDNKKIRLTNVSTFHPHVLKMDEDGHITDESIKSIVLLSRSPEQGYARQHLLLPKTWIDIHFGGDVPTIITGEITNLEEDMIEVTTYPDVEVIYIDFEYKGIPETIPLEQIVIRTKPASLEKIASMVDVREEIDGLANPEDFDATSILDNSSSIEYTDMGEAVIKHPPSVVPDPVYRDVLHSMFVSANEIIYGEELEQITERIELAPHQKRYGIETQVNDMLDELLSEIPNIKRTATVLDDIHLLIQRFRELHRLFSRTDTQGNVQDAKLMGLTFKPLVQSVLEMKKHIQWLIPVTSQRRKLYTSLHPESMTDVIQCDFDNLLAKDGKLQGDYYKHHNRSDIPAYTQYYQQSNAGTIPYEAPLYPDQYLATKQEIAVDIETVIQNMENFYSTVLQSTKDTQSYARRQYVIQRHCLGQQILTPTVSTQTGKRVYIRNQLTPNETMTVSSFLVLPPAAIKYSAVSLPGSSIATKTSLAQHPLLLFRLLHKQTDVQSRIIDAFDKETADKEHWLEPFERGEMKRSVQEFMLAETLDQQGQRYHKFVQSMVPSTNTVIDLLTQSLDVRHELSLKQITNVLEPFLVYVQDLNYYNYNHIRFFVKMRLKAYRKYMVEREASMASLRTMHYINSTPDRHPMMRLLLEKRDLFDLLIDAYKIPTDMREQHAKVQDAVKKEKPLEHSASEWISRILVSDNAVLFSDLIRYMMAVLVMPEDMANEFDKQATKREEEDMSKLEKIKATDCVRRVLTKRYSSIKDMQKDNGTNDVAYDKEFDTTPYIILSKYKEEEKKYGGFDFLEFLAEALVTKHECPRKLAGEMAKTLILGKKPVQEGEYAVVEIKPHFPEKVDESRLSVAERKEAEIEADVRKQVLYYRRVKNHWVHDDSIDENAFIDNNTLFCNMSTLCFKDTKTNVCEPIKDANERMRQIAKKRMVEEFDERFAETLQTQQDELRTIIEEKMRLLRKIERLREVQRTKANIVAYEIGRFAKTAEVLQSPHVSLRDQIMGQDDFVKRQHDLIRFATLYCRDPMAAELGENMYWLYCRDTNTALLPSFLLELARAFTSSSDYLQKQAEICRIQGILSDDGDSIVDRHSGYVIRKIDFVEETGYDDAGFKMLTSGIMEKDAGAKFLEAATVNANTAAAKDRVFENETAEMVFKIYSIVSTHIGLPLESIEEFVLRISLELIDKKSVIKSAVTYEKEVAIALAKGKKPPPYHIYRNKLIIFIVGAVILVGIQTATPSFKIRKTFPGCVQSFTGFPANGGGVEDMTGLHYIACILYKTKSSIAPWDSIQRIPLVVLQEQLKKVVEEAILGRADLMELYTKKREFLAQFPSEEEIPEEHAVSRWTRFLPPVVEFSIVKQLRPLSNDYKEELLELMRKGSRDQREHIDLFKTKCMMYGHGLIENIRTVVRSKDLLLKTASNLYFTENACCNDRNTARAMDYFAAEMETVVPAIKMIEGWSAVLHSVSEIGRASMLYDPKNTTIQYPPIPTQHYEQNVYAAFIWYCNLDREAPIPEEFRPLLPEKLVDYQVKWSLAEKIEHFKKEDKRLTLANLDQLMNVVQAKNIVETKEVVTLSTKKRDVAGLRDFLQYMSNKDEPLFVAPFIERMDAVLAKHNPRIMVVEDSEETRRLNNYLTTSNERMLTEIADFFQVHGNLTKGKFEALQQVLSNVHMWTLDLDDKGANASTSMYTVLQFMQNSIFSMSRVYPEFLQNNHSMNTDVPVHWNLSNEHQADITRFLRKYYEPLQKFKHDTVIGRLLNDVQTRLVDMMVFVQALPAFTAIDRDVKVDGETVKQHFYSLFDKRTLYMIHTYCWYSVIYEYISATDQIDLLQMDVDVQKEGRRERIRERADPFSVGQSPGLATIGEELDDASDLLDVQITMGNQKELKDRVAELLLVFLDIEGSNKKKLDLSYRDIEKNTTRSKQSEKKEITDFFENMDRDERRVEDIKKSMKLGRWNVGLQKGLVKYDKDTYDRERTDALIEDLVSRVDLGEMSDEQMERDVNDLALEDEARAEEEGDQEAFGLAGLTGDYRDGEYYEDDIDRDDGFGQEE